MATDAFLRMAAMKERDLIQSLTEILDTFRDHRELYDKLQAALKKQDVQAALKLIDFTKLNTTLYAHFGSAALGCVLAGAELADLPAAIKSEISFVMTNPKTLEYIKTMSFDESLRIATESKEAVRSAIMRAFREGGHPYDIARQIRDRIGLTDNQWTTVDNYSQFLDHAAGKDTLSMADIGKLRRGGYRGQGLSKVVLSEARKEQLIQGYVKRLLKERCETIARTLVIDASNAGQNALWQQAADNGLIIAGMWKVEWIAAPSERTCQLCNGLNGQKRSMNGTYSDGTKRPPRHLRCRCSEGLVKNRQ